MINKNKKLPRIVIIIPARLKSSRLRKKLLRKIDSLPMIIRVAKNAKKLELGRVVVGTDSLEIFNVCKNYNVETLMTKRIHKSGTDRVYEVYSLIKEEFDLIINLQGDLPVFTKELFKKIINLFSDDLVDIGSAICDLTQNEFNDENVVKAKVKLDENNTGFAKDFNRTFEHKENLYHHIGIYVYRPSVLRKIVNLSQTKKEQNRRLEQMRAMDNNFKIKLVKIPYLPPSVDTENDLKKIRLHFKKNNL